MKRYEIEYVGINEHTHLAEIKQMAIYGDRKEMLDTVKAMKNDSDITITNVYSVSNKEIYTKIKI